jgi:hypothetical protein
VLPPKADHVRCVAMGLKISEEMRQHFCKRISNASYTVDQDVLIFSIAVIAIVRLIRALDDKDQNLSEGVVQLLTKPEEVIGTLARFPKFDLTATELAEIRANR